MKIGLNLSMKAVLNTFTQPTLNPNALNLGINMAWITSYSNGWVFSNLMYHTGKEERGAHASGAYTANQGAITASDPLDTFRRKLADFANQIASSNLTILNPDGCEIQVSGYNEPGSGYTTATQFTFDASTLGSMALCLWHKGSCTNVKVIYTDQLAAWQAGSVWHSDFLSWHINLKARVLRTMDMVVASASLETDWADRILPTGMTMYAPVMGGKGLPWEFVLDLANRLGSAAASAGRMRPELWINIPARSTQSYLNELVSLVGLQLSPSTKLWIEHGNEIWNYAAPWAHGTAWTDWMAFTKRVATTNSGANTYTLAAHGLSNATPIALFDTVQNRLAGVEPNYQVRYGSVTTYCKVIDANTFQACVDVGLTNVIPVNAGLINAIVVNTVEAGKTQAMNVNYAAQSVRNWQTFVTALGQERVRRVLASQFANPTVTQGRLIGDAATQVSHVAFAPYFGGLWWGLAVDVSTGALLPKTWCSSSRTVYISVWAQGSTPTQSQLTTGTGAIAFQTQTYTAGPATYTAASSIGSLSNGTTYDVWALTVDSDGVAWSITGAVTVSATPSTVYITDTSANQLLRNKLSSIQSMAGMAAQKVHTGTKPVVCYEGGLHFHEIPPANLATWLRSYQNSSYFADAIEHDYHCLAATGAKLHNYYGDVLGTFFQLSQSFSDQTDARFVRVASFNGEVLPSTLVTQSDIGSGLDVAGDPGAFPYVIGTFASGRTYQLLSGDLHGNFAIVGNELRLVNDTNVNWGTPTLNTLRVLVTDGVTSDLFNVVFSMGDAWYQSDANYAFSSIDDSDNATMNPSVGTVLPRITGAGATIADAMWNMDGNGYYHATAANATMSLNNSLLIAMVLDKDNHSAGFATIAQFGGGDSWTFYTGSGVATNFCVRTIFAAGSIDNRANFVGSTPTGKHVYWAFWDATTGILTAGMDQTANATISPNLLGRTLSRNVSIGGSTGAAASSMKYGSFQVVSRAGWTLAQAMTAVAKMQSYHSIL